MKQGKYAAPVRRRRRRNTLKPMLIAMAVVLLLGCVTGGTLAWLTSTTDAVTNTFTTSNITISLAETTGNSYKMIPGYTITKDPKVTVTKGSEKCYVFIKVVESDNFDDFMSYSIISDGDDAWTQLTSVTGKVYYRVVDASAATSDVELPILVNDQIQVSDKVTKGAMNALTENTYPTLTFQAAAIQYNDSNSTNFAPKAAYDQIDWNAAASTATTP